MFSCLCLKVSFQRYPFGYQKSNLKDARYNPLLDVSIQIRSIFNNLRQELTAITLIGLTYAQHFCTGLVNRCVEQ